MLDNYDSGGRGGPKEDAIWFWLLVASPLIGLLVGSGLALYQQAYGH